MTFPAAGLNRPATRPAPSIGVRGAGSRLQSIVTIGTCALSLGLLSISLWPAQPCLAGGEIYGTIHLESGRSFTGPIRWDLNEVFWDDVLDAEKCEKVWVDGGFSGVKLWGLSVGDESGYWTQHPFKIQFGHLAMIERKGSSRIRVELKSGQRVEIRATGTDLGESMRGLAVIDGPRGDVDVSWDDIEMVEFKNGPGDGRDAERLYGLVETQAGGFTGFITWDRDEALVSDTLDGESGDEDHHIPFSDISEIERVSSRSSRVTLTDGSKLRLSGTNDVDDDNRGIDVLVPDLGVVKVPWEEFDRVVFEPPPASHLYSAFDGGRRLHGTLTDDEGESFTGFIMWDMDEQYTWEFLDGQYEDLEFEIPFALIESIRRESRNETEVRLKSGISYVLSGSNDVDSDNKGIVVELPDGDELELDWQDFESLEFDDK